MHYVQLWPGSSLFAVESSIAVLFVHSNAKNYIIILVSRVALNAK